MTSLRPTPPIFYVPRPGRVSATLRSRLRPLDISPPIVDAILAHYDLALTAPSRNLPNTRRNRNLIVHTTRGKKILKLYRADWRETTIRFEHSILEQLARLDSPAPRLCQAADGRTFIDHFDASYALFDFIEGKTYTSSYLLRPHRLQLMRLAGQTLARLHRTLRGFQPASYHHLGFGDYAGQRHRDMAWHEQKIEALTVASRRLPAGEAREPAERMVRHGEAILADLGRLDTHLAQARLPRLVIHGDYGLHNLLFQSVDQATPVDFELARLEWRLSDLVSCLSKLRYAGGHYDYDSMTGFLDGYRAAFPIDDDEWRHFPDVWQLYRLMGAVQYWSSYFETNGPVRKLNAALDAVAQAAWARANPQQTLAINSAWRGDHV